MSLLDIFKSADLEKAVQELGNGIKSKNNLINNANGITGLIGAGVLGALLGSVIPITVARGAALIGAGAIAWNFYKKWSKKKQADTEEEEASGFNAFRKDQEDSNLDNTAILLIRAVVYAARADGQISSEEQARIRAVLRIMLPGQNVDTILATAQTEMINPELISSQITTKDQAEDVYRLSCVVIDIDHILERTYLDNLAQCLNIEKIRQSQLESDAEEGKKELTRLCQNYLEE